MKIPQPRSLMGQMLLAVAAALLLVQGLGSFLIYKAQREAYEAGMLNVAAFRLIVDTRGPGAFSATARTPRGPIGSPPPRSFPLEFATRSPVEKGEARDARAESRLQAILEEQNFPQSEVVIVHRAIGGDPVARHNALRRAVAHQMNKLDIDDMLHNHLLVVGVRPLDQQGWLVARVRSPRAEHILLTPLVLQTLLIYIVLVGAVALILRRITRPLAALTRRVERFANTADTDGQLMPSGPEDMRRLIVAHNAMEGRIAAMLDEKNVMLGAIGHDLKTPLAALRVRIESVQDEGERARMAGTIEDIVRTLDDILSLARVGRPGDPLERTEFSALVASVVEEYEDMGEPVELGDTERIVLELRPTWLRRALRNLIGNAVRYGQRARVSLKREGRNAVVLIDDDGPGIPTDTIEDMMNPFTRGDPSRNSATGGAGLGLALARAIADQHGGALKLTNRLSATGEVEGLTARLEIPVQAS
ncbi:sensor histidine kinase [Novosphingobium mangrovi (ex Huang et al. 2023)]|uniref:histidine kinase n=1 Tax=Novosphingobium mangrovi (ex Huang et al. 2023) TaxID=2976432 RepID=A0ABT2I361_9SPHN|nr:ATP-binding protein [Novosphingobium mangrovi (ex Huang et al. 2023)]MCT2399239.1 ATP-binding protein [Novosphingobium mangrovi (ex Huang et al. 2023)]